MTHRTHHMQTPEGRQLSANGRQRRLAGLPAKTAPQLFVVRRADTQFGWEIRKFGSFVLSHSDARFETSLLAREAGERVLTELTRPA